MVQETEIRTIILNVLNSMSVNVSRIVLFGSQARQDANENSDWDLLIVVNQALTKKDRKDIYCRVKRALVSLMIPTDVLIRSESEVKSTSQLPRNITTVALKEGICIYE
ncbi:MAG: nucleotidyltransferase domain-containing protein [Caldisericia bacterium]|nr:nucleotidyltransferase domain-containing protein [Caldisericia bacterium]